MTTWTQFLTAMATAYFGYYSLNLIADMMRQGRTATATRDEPDELFFDDEEPPVVALPESEADEDTSEESQPEQEAPVSEEPVVLGGPVESTGAVSIRELFQLARMDLIEYTRTIPYAQ
jgi:hypothetical protein